MFVGVCGGVGFRCVFLVLMLLHVRFKIGGSESENLGGEKHFALPFLCGGDLVGWRGAVAMMIVHVVGQVCC